MDFNFKDLEQVHICLNTKGIATPDPRRYAFSLMNTVLGGNMSSRLFQKIREDRGLAYSVYSYAASYEDTGMFGAYAGTDVDHAFTVVELILKEMRKIKTKKIPKAELKNAKEYTKGALLLASESTDNQMVRLAQNEINMGHQIPMEEIIEKIEAVTSDGILELAQSLFDTRQLSLTTLGPVEKTDRYHDIFHL
jgi:predicted Zn-dependent peptidase